MGKTLEQKSFNNIDEVFLKRKNNKLKFVQLGEPEVNCQTLTSCVQYINRHSGKCVVNEELPDKNVYLIALELAKAIDRNSVIDIKKLKALYGYSKEFLSAKEFLNQKCKQVWDVCENKHKKMEVPAAAMRTLGITNVPSLDFFLANCIKYSEKPDSKATANVIASILSNPNIDYTLDEIYDYMKSKYVKDGCRYSFITVAYVASKFDYNREKLLELGADEGLIKQIFKSLSLKEKFRYLLTNKFSCL